MLEVDRVPLTDLQHMDLDPRLSVDEITFVVITHNSGRIVGERKCLELTHVQLNPTLALRNNVLVVPH